MSINWSSLRPWNGSQEKAFEELCCQLAAAESVPGQSRFFRKGTPDAGVECFWQLPNGDEWAWQAKFFLRSLSSTQWGEIDGSVRTAIEQHSNLTKYTICLAVDRSDARIARQRSFLAKWEDRTKKWEKFAASKGISVTFDYWGQSEIGRRLSDEKHRGRLWFWFREESLSNTWFIDRVNVAVANAKDRYLPAQNIDLPVRSNFDGLGRTPAFIQQLEHLYSQASVKLKKIPLGSDSNPFREKHDHILNITQELLAKIEPWVKHDQEYVEWTATQTISWDNIRWLAEQLCAAIDECISLISDLKRDGKREKTKGTQESSDYLNSQLYYLQQFHQSVDEILGYSKTNETKLSNLPALLLVGGAGQGKTHLLCHIAKQETERFRPRLFLQGEQFRDDEPWSQIIRHLGLNCSLDEFIGALEAAAQANHCRILIFIDALNEGDGNRLWWKFLPGMLTTLAKSRWLGICVSVRKAYEAYIIPETLDESRIIRLEHRGFQDLTYEAIGKFFSHYGLEPTIPVLTPEFDNPLFLTLFCRGLQNAGHTRVQSGPQGISKIFHFFIDSIDKKLSRPDYLDYDVRSKVVTEAVANLASEMAKRGTSLLPRAEAEEIINAVLPRVGYQNSLFHHLESEGVLTVIPVYTAKRNVRWTDSVCFTYQRLSDHLITQCLLNQHLNKTNPKASFARTRSLGKLVKDKLVCWSNQGLVEALAIQIPELTGKELPDLAPHTADWRPMRKAFVESLIWRNETSFSKATDDYVNNHVLAYADTYNDLWNAALMLALKPNHPYNARCLDEILKKISMAERDAWWSTLLHREWGEERAVDRIVAWAWEDNDKSSFEDEVVRLAGITLSWFFTSANRFLRDRATKAMVRLFERRIDLLRQVMEEFIDLDDPYVIERLYAVAYGCAMRGTDKESLRDLAQDVYRWVFKAGKPMPHILSRDYARGVIEAALYHRISLDFDAKKVRPPYRSDWPSFDIPELEDLKSWGEWKEGMSEGELARVHLYNSVMGGGMVSDFSHYVVGHLDEWSSEKIDEPHKPTHEELHDQFVVSLTHRQREAWDLYCSVLRYVDLCHYAKSNPRENDAERQPTEAELNFLRETAETNLAKALRKNSKKYKLFRDSIAEYLAEPHKYYKEDAFDPQLARRWMMKRIIDMGWTVERFGSFDRNVDRYGPHHREAHKPERIGKKYQWIAYHELLARLSDNFQIYREELPDGRVAYNGPWDIGYIRDIDPSNLLPYTFHEEWSPNTNTWWFPTEFESWDEPADTVQWLKRSDNLPQVKRIIEVTSSADNTVWLTISGRYHWEQPTPVGEDRYGTERRQLRYDLECYLVKKDESHKLLKWAAKQSWFGGWMPKSTTFHEIFLGEFFWSPAFQDVNCYYYGHEGWTRKDERIPAEIMLASETYGRESNGFDCSTDENILIELPCKLLIDGMNLDWCGVEGEWYDAGGQMVAYDPSVKCQGPRALLFRRDSLLAFLDRQGLTVFWALIGEKQMIGRSFSYGEYSGTLEINGTYFLKGDTVSGTKVARYIAPGGKRRQPRTNEISDQHE